MNKGKHKNKTKLYRLLPLLLPLHLVLYIFNTTTFEGSINNNNDDFSAMQVHFIDVGQGDCTLIISGGEAMLIDAGNNDKGTLVQSYLQSQGISTLDIVYVPMGIVTTSEANGIRE